MTDFPNAPTDGDRHTENGTTWVYRSPPNCWQVLVQETVSPVEIVGADVSAGWQVWGDVLIQWGVGTTESNGTGVFAFPVDFGGATIPNVLLTPSNGGDTDRWAHVATRSSANVTVKGYDDNGSREMTVMWFAIGEAPDNLKKPKTIGVS